MEVFYLIIIGVLFLLAVSDLIVGVSNDAVNFLNAAVGSKATTYKLILIVAAVGIMIGCTFSSGMMEVARKGIFHPEQFYFSELMLIFLAVMVTDVILLDAFNTFGMPTSTTVSIVFELLGASVAISIIKLYMFPSDMDLGDYINSGKALAIISGILLSVVIAFTSGGIIQYLTRMLFSFDYEKRLKYFGALWGGAAVAAITYFLLIKGSGGASFMDDELKATINRNTWMILAGSFVVWAIILQLLILFTRVNIFTLIVLIGTFALSMAFAGNDLVNFIGVPLAGYNSYEIWIQSGAGDPDGLLMSGLAGKVPTPTILLLLAGVIMTVTLWYSKKARSVVQTSLDLGRQYEGSERFTSYAISRQLVRNATRFSTMMSSAIPSKWKTVIARQFDEQPFAARQAAMGKDAPSFDLIRASVTLVVASILITMGTNLKLPLSTTYVAFMVFMGTSLADGAWGRESAVYRVSGVISVIGGWFFTALSAFVISFIFAGIFYFGGSIAILVVMLGAVFMVYRSHRYHKERLEEQLALEQGMEQDQISRTGIIALCSTNIQTILGGMKPILDETLQGLSGENLPQLNAAHQAYRKLLKKAEKIKRQAGKTIDKVEDDQIDAAHLYILVADYLHEMTSYLGMIVKPNLDHVDNNHKPLTNAQVQELAMLQDHFQALMDRAMQAYQRPDEVKQTIIQPEFDAFVKLIRTYRKNQIKRIRNQEIGTRNSVLYLNYLSELRNLAFFSGRMIRVLTELVMDPDGDSTTELKSTPTDQ
ncbi:MAG: inorganic phosphate transporter [Lewinellaceae bacterium]|nr:inorganic phosphate transporter [Saprospiraceae bacterium]MCB9313748.1 inorganic phosphate transporter [Lewinellaceae bacterium]